VELLPYYATNYENEGDLMGEKNSIKFAWFSEFKDIPPDQLRQSLSQYRWILLNAEDLPNATAVWMFAELDGFFIGLDHRGSEYLSGIHNRAIHLLLIDEEKEIRGISKVFYAKSDSIENYLW
jgi:hypothetical protein